MKPNKHLLIVADVADFASLEPILAEKIALGAKSLGYQTGFCLISRGNLKLSIGLVASLTPFHEIGNLHGIEAINSETHPEEGRSLLDDALLKIEVQKKKDTAPKRKNFPGYFDCPYMRALKRRNKDTIEIRLDAQGKISMRCDCVRKKITLGNIAEEDLRKILASVKKSHAKLLKEILKGDPKGKLSCSSCLKVTKAYP